MSTFTRVLKNYFSNETAAKKNNKIKLIIFKTINTITCVDRNFSKYLRLTSVYNTLVVL